MPIAETEKGSRIWRDSSVREVAIPGVIGSDLERDLVDVRIPLTLQHFPSVDALLRSHHELRAAVRLSGQKIAKLNFGRRDDPVLEFLRRTLREARAVAKAAQEQPRQN